MSEQYRDTRRSQILRAAKRCFVRNGFHETSMQDLFAESGLSSGAVYRYFPRKEDMILAIAEENMQDVVALIHTLAAQTAHDGIGEMLAAILELLRQQNRDDALGSIAVLVWAEAVRNPVVAERFEGLLAQMRSDLADAVVRRQHVDASVPSVDPDDFASLLLAVVPGFILQLAVFGDGRMANVPDAARALIPG